MSDKDDCPFKREQGRKSLRSVFDTFCSTWENLRLDDVAEYGDKIISVIKSLEEGDYYTIGNESLQALNSIYSSYNSKFRQFSDSKASVVWDRFRERKEEGGCVVPGYITPLYSSFIEEHLDVTYIEEEEGEEDQPSSKDKFCKCTTPEGRHLFWVDAGYEYSDIIFEEDDREIGLKAWEEVLEKVWSSFDNHIEIVMDEKKNDFLFQRKQRLPWEYEGDQGRELIERWRKFKQEGVRRSVILHGSPGTGKSTLARQATKELEGRVIFTPVRTILDCPSVNYFSNTLESLRPDILIIDDLDRLHQSALETLLDFFEETENPVPFILATTNHLEELPDAIKRPGRFDEIWEVKPPNDEVRKQVISYLADLEDFDISDETLERIAEISKERDLPGSHIREIIRRVKIMGEDELDFSESDLTFDDDWIEENYSENQINGGSDSMAVSGNSTFTLEEF